MGTSGRGYFFVWVIVCLSNPNVHLHSTHDDLLPVEFEMSQMNLLPDSLTSQKFQSGNQETAMELAYGL